MKSKKLQHLERILRWMAIVVLKKYDPSVVGITGSVGKSSAKEAVFCVLSSRFNVRKNEKNYNNEVGIPLTIIGAESGNKSLIKWTIVFLKWLWLVVFPCKYPDILVLEMGVDRPGDMKYLLSFIHPIVGIVTKIGSSHLEFFEDIEHIAKEKGKLIQALPEEGAAILNIDDKRVFSAKQGMKAKRLITFGLKENADLQASYVGFNYENGNLAGISFKFSYDGSIVPVRMRYVLAEHMVNAALVGAAAGIFFKINLAEIADSLQRFKAPEGRINLIRGIKGSFIVDDTYNSSPSSAVAALDVVEGIKAARKIVVLGDMLELGHDNKSGHESVAEKVHAIKADVFIGVGDRMMMAERRLQSIGFDAKKIFHFNDPMSAGKYLQNIMRSEDLVLVKGSQGMRMEKVVEEVMVEPEKVQELLCRQSADWRKKAYNKP